MLGQHPGFISYSRKDGAEFAADLRKTLEKENLSVWQDIVALEGGRDWWSQIEDAFSLSRFFVRLEWRLAPPPPKPRTGAKAGGAGSRKSLWCFTRQDSDALFPAEVQSFLNFLIAGWSPDVPS
jgi:TIR domain